jgi:hypothetical protein
MLDWYTSHQAEVGTWLEWLLYFNGFLIASAFLYLVYDLGLWEIGLRRHAAVVRKEPQVEQFPDAYFAMLAVQLLPLTITGFVRHDAFVIGTRIATLATVLIVYGISSSKTGTFDTLWYRLWILFWLAVVVIGPMVYVGSRTLQAFIADYEKGIAYSSVVVMILFVIYGQRVAASTLFNHFVSGNYSIKRFGLQIVRFFGFSCQAAHYGLVFGWRDAIFLQGLIGALGVFGVIVSSIFGLIKGTAARRLRRAQAQATA